MSHNIPATAAAIAADSGGGTTNFLRADGTWAVPAGGESGNAFRTIAVSGQSNVVADAPGDTLTLVAGTNITLTTDAASDTVTIAASGGGGGGDASMLFGAITTSTNSSNTVYAAVSGSDVTVEAGKTYWIRWLMRTYSAANTTAPRPRRILAGGAVGTVYGFHYVGQSNASAAMVQSSREATNDPFLATGNATSSTTASGSLTCECLFGCTTGGTIGLEFLSEVNASLVTINGDGSFWVATVRTT